MLGFGIGEIILIIVVAIIVLGPDKLPNALIEMAKFIRVVKRTMQDAKETLDREVNLAEIKKEAEAYKAKLEQSADISKDIKDANLIGEIQKDMNDIQHLFQDYQPKPVQLDGGAATNASPTLSDSQTSLDTPTGLNPLSPDSPSNTNSLDKSLNHSSQTNVPINPDSQNKGANNTDTKGEGAQSAINIAESSMSESTPTQFSNAESAQSDSVTLSNMSESAAQGKGGGENRGERV